MWHAHWPVEASAVENPGGGRCSLAAAMAAVAIVWLAHVAANRAASRSCAKISCATSGWASIRPPSSTRSCPACRPCSTGSSGSSARKERPLIFFGHCWVRNASGSFANMNSNSPANTSRRPAPAPIRLVQFAAERTLLAWIRTGLALMGFGFVVAGSGCSCANG